MVGWRQCTREEVRRFVPFVFCILDERVKVDGAVQITQAVERPSSMLRCEVDEKRRVFAVPTQASPSPRPQRWKLERADCCLVPSGRARDGGWRCQKMPVRVAGGFGCWSLGRWIRRWLRAGVGVGWPAEAWLQKNGGETWKKDEMGIKRLGPGRVICARQGLSLFDEINPFAFSSKKSLGLLGKRRFWLTTSGC